MRIGLAVVVGSDLSCLTTAAILAKTGRKVLVLEQHDQAGGCCHTFIDKTYEFDVGIHYIGEMGVQTVNKTLLDQVCDGQIEWAPLEDEFDVVQIGVAEDRRRYPVVAGKDKWRQLLKEQFPKETAAIDKYFEMMQATKASTMIHFALKMAPLWAARLAIASGAPNFNVIKISLLCKVCRCITSADKPWKAGVQQDGVEPCARPHLKQGLTDSDALQLGRLRHPALENQLSDAVAAQQTLP